jgi:hypothetical protein
MTPQTNYQTSSTRLKRVLESAAPILDVNEKRDEVGCKIIQVLEAEEGTESKKRLLVKVIREGKSLNGYIYTAQALRELPALVLERKKFYMDHKDPWYRTASRPLTELVAIAYEAWYDEKDSTVYAKIEFAGNPATEWLYDLAVKSPDEVGLSIDARVRVSEKEVEGPDGDIMYEYSVENFVFLYSTDFVSYPAAGGKTVSATESLQGADNLDTPEKWVEALQNLSTKVDTITEHINKKPGRPNMDPEEIKLLTVDALEKANPSLVADLRKKLEADLKESLKTQEEATKVVTTLESERDQLKGEVITLTQERDALKLKVDNYEVAEATAQRKAKIDKMVADSELPATAVTESFMAILNKMDKDEEIQAAIEDRKALVASAAPADPKVTGLGKKPAAETQESTAIPSVEDFVKSVKGR